MSGESAQSGDGLGQQAAGASPAPAVSAGGPHASRAGAGQAGVGQVGAKTDPMILWPLLVSGIMNLIFAASFLLSGIIGLMFIFGICFLVFVPLLIVLTVFEFKLFNQLNKPGNHAHLVPKVRQAAVMQICSIILFNWVSMVCGILQFTVNKEKLDAMERGAI